MEGWWVGGCARGCAHGGLVGAPLTLGRAGDRGLDRGPSITAANEAARYRTGLVGAKGPMESHL